MTIKIEYNNVSTFNHKKENKEKEKSKAPFQHPTRHNNSRNKSTCGKVIISKGERSRSQSDGHRSPAQ